MTGATVGPGGGLVGPGGGLVGPGGGSPAPPFAGLSQPFVLGSVGSELHQLVHLEGPIVRATRRQRFAIVGRLGSALSQPFAVVADSVGTELHQLFDFLAAGGTGLPAGVPPIWLPLMVFDKAGTYLGSIAAYNVTGPPVRYLRSRRVTNEGRMTFSVPRSSPDIELIASDRLVRLQSARGEAPWWGTMSPSVSAGGVQEVECADGYTILRDGPAVTVKELVGDATPATAVYARVMGIHNDLRLGSGEAAWELDLGGSRPFRGDLDLDTDTLSALDLVISRSRTELAVDSRLEGNRLVPVLRVRDRFDAGAGAPIFDGPGGNVVANPTIVEDPTPLVFSIRLRGTTTDLSKCLPEWAQWAIADVTPEVTVSVSPGAYRNRQRRDESLDWGLSSAAVQAQCNAIVEWIWSLYRSFLKAVHDIEGRPWHDGWVYLGPPDIYEPKAAGKDSLSRRAWRTRLELVEIDGEPASAIMLSDKACIVNLREWLVVRYDRASGVQTVETQAMPSVAGASLVKWNVGPGGAVLYQASGGRVTARSTIANTGAFVDPYTTPIYDPVLKRTLNMRRVISGSRALVSYVYQSDPDNKFVDLGPDAAVAQAAGDGSSFIGKVYDFEEDRIDDYDPRRDGIGVRRGSATVFDGKESSKPRWHIGSFNVGGDAATGLTSGISATEPSIEMDSIDGFPDPDLEPGAFPFLVAIDSGSNKEIVKVLGMTGTLWNVVRGQGGTEAIIHEGGATVGREGAPGWPGFAFPYSWPEGQAWASDELAEVSKPLIRVQAHISHFRGDQLTIDYGSTHAVDVASEGPPGRWVGTERVIGWSTDAVNGETEVVGEWLVP